ncbi:hypothetical protein WM04_02220 [Burkholderia ubonensis]|nr:hypothetical protein WM04_02220 [Burkholderia ubonensis]OJB12939.1 hypothetical protein BGV53_25780 [Burkholderia ubonensis]
MILSWQRAGTDNRTENDMASKYGNMPANPNLIAKVRGDAGEYNVLGVDWFSHRVLLDRTITNEWVDIAKVAIQAAKTENE